MAQEQAPYNVIVNSIRTSPLSSGRGMSTNPAAGVTVAGMSPMRTWIPLLRFSCGSTSLGTTNYCRRPWPIHTSRCLAFDPIEIIGVMNLCAASANKKVIPQEGSSSAFGGWSGTHAPTADDGSIRIQRQSFGLLLPHSKARVQPADQLGRKVRYHRTNLGISTA